MNTSQAQAQAGPALLDQAKFQAIAGAFSRLQSLGDKQIVAGFEDSTQQEKEKLIQYLATEMLAHIAEFLAAYQLCHSEYLPLCNGVRRMMVRCGYAPTPAPQQ